jgi:hypothetical protein
VLKRILLAAALFAMGSSFAVAQVATGNEFQTSTSGKLVTGVVNMCVNGSNIAVPCGSSSAPVLTSTSGSANIATGQVTVGTTATQIVPARSGRISVKTTDLGTTDLFCGAAGVTTATGDLLGRRQRRVNHSSDRCRFLLRRRNRHPGRLIHGKLLSHARDPRCPHLPGRRSMRMPRPQAIRRDHRRQTCSRRSTLSRRRSPHRPPMLPRRAA